MTAPRPRALVRVILLAAAIPATCLIPWYGLRFLAFNGHPFSVVTELQAHQIRDGTTRDEVRAILGEPHGTDPDDPQLGWYYYCDFPTWMSDPLYIDFDDNGRVNWISR